jgi:hypothetical protein
VDADAEQAIVAGVVEAGQDADRCEQAEQGAHGGGRLDPAGTPAWCV